MKPIVIYFSASGTTKKIAAIASGLLKTKLFEIKPQVPYTKGDLNWMNPFSRCNREHLSGKDVPIEKTDETFTEYDTVMLGFPIWYGCAPKAVESFCRQHDWTNKKIYIFATSGGSGMGKTSEKLQPFLKHAEILSQQRITGRYELENWLDEEKLL